MPRCPDCNKFVALQEEDPEVQSLEVDEEGTVTAEVRIVNVCANCNTELTEYTFSVDDQIGLPEPDDDHEHDLEVEEVSSERTQPDHTPPGQKPPPARYRKTYYGFELTVKVTCKGCDLEEELVLADDVQASGMEVLV
jgi:hypothetical protein